MVMVDFLKYPLLTNLEKMPKFRRARLAEAVIIEAPPSVNVTDNT